MLQERVRRMAHSKIQPIVSDGDEVCEVASQGNPLWCALTPRHASLMPRACPRHACQHYLHSVHCLSQNMSDDRAIVHTIHCAPSVGPYQLHYVGAVMLQSRAMIQILAMLHSKSRTR